MIKALAQTRVKYAQATALFNMFGMPMLIADLVQKKLLLIDIQIPFLAILVAGFIFLMVMGEILDRSGWIEEEQSYIGQKNREFKKLHDKKLHEVIE